MARRSEEKFKEWVEKIERTLNDEYAHSLPENCKWLLYWHDKIRRQDINLFRKIDHITNDLLEQSALKMRSYNLAQLEQATNHREGTKVRFTKLMSCVYQYEHYIHPLLVETKNLQVARSTIQGFNEKHLNEIVCSSEYSESHHAIVMIRYLECAAEVNVEVEDSVIDLFTDLIRRDAEPARVSFYHSLLNCAERNLEEDRTMVATVLACEALRGFLHDLCLLYGAAEKKSYYHPSEPFESWEFPEWLGYLKSMGKSNLEDMIEFTVTHRAWYEKLGKPDYVQPMEEDVEEEITNIRFFIDLKENEPDPRSHPHHL